MLINVARIATSNGFGQAITAIRTFPGVYINGLYEAGRTSQIALKASVQPAGSKDLSFLPEGQRTKQLMKFITVQRLQTADESESNTADVIMWNGNNWRVINVQDWKRHGYFRSVAEQLT